MLALTYEVIVLDSYPLRRLGWPGYKWERFGRMLGLPPVQAVVRPCAYSNGLMVDTHWTQPHWLYSWAYGTNDLQQLVSTENVPGRQDTGVYQD